MQGREGVPAAAREKGRSAPSALPLLARMFKKFALYHDVSLANAVGSDEAEQDGSHHPAPPLFNTLLRYHHSKPADPLIQVDFQPTSVAFELCPHIPILCP